MGEVPLPEGGGSTTFLTLVSCQEARRWALIPDPRSLLPLLFSLAPFYFLSYSQQQAEWVSENLNSSGY